MRDGRPGQAVRDLDIERERVSQVPRFGRQKRPRHRAPDVVDHDVEPPERVHRGRGQARRGVEVGQVGRDDDRTPPGRLDLARDLGQLLPGPGRDHHVGARLSQRQRDRRADSPASAGHHRRAIRDAKPIQDHRSSLREN